MVVSSTEMLWIELAFFFVNIRSKVIFSSLVDLKINFINEIEEQFYCCSILCADVGLCFPFFSGNIRERLYAAFKVRGDMLIFERWLGFC